MGDNGEKFVKNSIFCVEIIGWGLAKKMKKRYNKGSNG